jgi:anti-sigma-K factor RskA
VSDAHPHDELAAYALDALDPPEADRVAAHVQGCDSCAGAVGEYQDVAAALALRLPHAAPSPELRRRVLEAASGADGHERRPHPMRVVRARSWVERLRRNLLGTVAAAVAVAALAWGAFLQAQVARIGAENAQLAEQAASYERVIAVLEAPDFTVRDLSADAAAGADGRVYFDAGSGRGMLMVHSLPPPPEDKAYQVWLVHNGRRTSAALFRTSADGWGYTFLQSPEPIGGYDALGITLEPAGGSAAPTGPRLLGARIAPA